ncbi:TPA: glycosyltransferase [Staphylococcus aureus]|nr:glycosyltransferase [Staphylococcus aureus]
MNYILGTILESKITGVEKAQINRLKLFKQHGISSKCVYVKWNPYSYTYAKQHQIENDVFTMYDYFQKAINYKKTKQVNWIQYWEKSCRYTLKFVENSNDVRIYDEEQFVMYAHFLDKQYHQLNYVNYFDHKRRKVKRELYDGRGFLSCSRILAGLNQSIPVVVVLHSTHLSGTGNGIKSFYKTVFNNLTRYKAIVVSTEQQCQDISQYIENKIPVINIPVGYVANLKYQFDINQKEKNHIISIARLVENKQIKHQIEVIKQLVTKHPNIQLNIYGHGNGLSEYRQLVEDYHLSEHVKFHGFKTHINEEIAKAELMLSTSKMEGFGLAILESLSVGTPVISYDIDYGPSELIQDGFNGYLVPKGDINQMVEKVDQLLNNTQKLQQFSINSIESAQQYNATTISTKWQNILN